MTTPNKSLAQPAYNSLNWDAPLNQNFAMLDAALGAVQFINLQGYASPFYPLTAAWPITGTSASLIPLRLGVSGTPANDVTITTPSGVLGMWIVGNYTGGGHNIYVQVAGGAGAAVLCANGRETLVYCDGVNFVVVGSNVLQSATFSPGDLKWSASPNGSQGWILCYGQAISRTVYSALFNAIGSYYGSGDGSTTFNVPDMRGRVGCGADDMWQPAGRLSGYSLGVAGGAQSVILTDPSQNAAHTHGDYGHGHAGSQDPHAHALAQGNPLIGGTGIGFGSGFQFGSANTDTRQPNVYIGTGYANLANSGGGGAHANVQPTLAFFVYIYAGV